MRRVIQLAVLTGLTTPGVLLLGPIGAAQAAGTQTVNPAVIQTAWYWQTVAEQANPPVAPPAPPPTEPSGVPAGDVAVAHTSTDGSSSKMTAIAFQVNALKPGATVTGFDLTITLDSSGTNVNAAAAPIVACLPTRLWSAQQGGDYTDQPPVDCDTKAVPKVKGDTYTFAIAGIAQQWVGDVNAGVGLVNDPDNTQTPFQAVFSVKSIKATMHYTPAVAPPGPATVGTGSLGGTGSGNGSGVAASTGSSASTVGGVAAAPVKLPPSAPTTTTTPDAGQAPEVATTTPSSHPAALAKPASSSPSTAFWLAAIAIALLVVVAGAVLADDAVVVPNAVNSRLGRVLRERQRQAAAAAAAEPTDPDTTPTLTLRRV